jgi:hypothetical protein
MRNRLIRSALFVLMLMAGTARAANGQTCLVIDEPRDTLGRDERIAALLLLGKEFERAGQPVVDRDCAATYTVAHIRLGTTIVVSLSGPKGSREAKALGLDDLPAVYSQMVRSLTTGEPIGSLAVVDRTNVSASQDLPPRRVRAEGYWYARLGYGSLFTDSTHNGAAFGFGYRAEFNRLGLEVSFFNMQLNDAGGYSGASSSASSLIKLQGLFFTNPTGNRSAYFGGGLSYGRTHLHSANIGDFPASGHGSGLQAGLTAGYEIARVTSARLFVQADVTLPFYDVVLERYTYSQTPSNGRYVPPMVTTERQYVPSVAVSVGLGWQRRSR